MSHSHQLRIAVGLARDLVNTDDGDYPFTGHLFVHGEIPTDDVTDSLVIPRWWNEARWPAVPARRSL